MARIICPDCKESFNKGEKICPHCGYPYDYINKLASKGVSDYSALFFKSIREHNKYVALRALGVLQYLNCSESEPLYALVYMEEGYIDKAIKIFEDYYTKIKDIKDKNDEQKKRESLYLNKLIECLALKGNIAEVQKTIKDNKNVLRDYWKVNYYAVLATRNANTWQLGLYIKEKEEGNLDDDVAFLERATDFNIDAKNDIKDIIADTLVDITVLLRDLVRVHDISKGESVISLEDNYRPGIYKSVLIYSGMLFGEEYELIPLVDEIYHYSGLEDKGTEEYTAVCNKAAAALYRLMFTDRPASPGQVIKYISNLIKIDALGRAKRKADRECELIYKQLLDDNQDAINLITEMDILNLVDTSSGPLYEYKKEVLAQNDGYNNYVLGQQVYNSLSSRGVYAFQVAEWAFEKSLDGDYSWKDAGPLSLNYFRIIELELNQKMVVPIASGEQYRELSSVVKQEKKKYDKNLDKDQIEEYQKRWGSILYNLKMINSEQDPTDGFELGTLERFIKNIIPKERSEYSAGDETGAFLYNKVCSLMTEKGIEALVNGEIISIISKDKREKFRNPPAHTRYLPYSIANECREYVISTLHVIPEWFKNEYQ